MSLAWAAPEVRCHANKPHVPHAHPPLRSVYRGNAAKAPVVGRNRNGGVDSEVLVSHHDGFTTINVGAQNGGQACLFCGEFELNK